MAEPLWTSAGIIAATGGVGHDRFKVTGLSIDTRSLQPGDLFVALQDRRDGHDFVDMAFQAGAAGALVSRQVRSGPVVCVPDVLPALAAMAHAARVRAGRCRRFAVTGSVGKTSVKDMLARMFAAQGRAHWSVKSFNNHWGVPLSLARMPPQTRHGVFEVGMNTPGEIAPHSQMIMPHTAVITRIAPAHLEGMGTLDAIAREKAGIFSGLLPGGFAILPFADPFRPFLAARARALQPDCQVLTFGTGPGPDAAITDICVRQDRMHVTIRIHERDVCLMLNAVGDHWALNAAAALLAACPDDRDGVLAMAGALDGYGPLPGRGAAEVLPLPDGGQFTLVDDAYNANPESMRAALAGFAARPCAGRRIVALGDMLEMGKMRDVAHAGLARPVKAVHAARVFMAGSGMAALDKALGKYPPATWVDRAEALDPILKDVLTDKDVLLLKGSNASGISRLAGRLRQWAGILSDDQTHQGFSSGGRDVV